MNKDINKSGSYLTYKLGKEVFAIHVSKVLNILEIVEITPVPKSPDYMKGVINLRGTVLPVIDTRIKFGMSPTEITPNTCILVISITEDGESITVGAMVDSVQEVLEIQENNIEPPLTTGVKYRLKYITGVFKHHEQFTLIINSDLVLSTSHEQILEDATSAEEQ